MAKKNVLGRGVGALLPESGIDSDSDAYFRLDIDKIDPNPHQPRKNFDEEKLQELADSIAEHGIIQPLIVARNDENRYNVIAGERRLRAAKLAGLDEVPVVLIDSGSDNDQLELALIENIQRQDLNPIEEAMAYSRLIKDFGLTQEQAAQKVGKKRSTVTNTLRLLTLPEYLQSDVASNRISEGHARVLLRLREMPDKLNELRTRIIKEDLSVRATERICKLTVSPKQQSGTTAKKSRNELPASYCRTLVNQLVNHLNTKVRITQNGARGKLEIEYYSSDDLDRLVGLLTRES